MHTFSFKKMRVKMSSAERRPFCLGPNVLRRFCDDWLHSYGFLTWKISTLEANTYVHCFTQRTLFLLNQNIDDYSKLPIFANIFSKYHFDSNFDQNTTTHDDVIKWKHFLRYWPFVRGIHWSPVNSPHKGQWRGSLVFSLICAWTHSWVNNPDAGCLRRNCAHYDVTVMSLIQILYQLMARRRTNKLLLEQMMTRINSS